MNLKQWQRSKKIKAEAEAAAKRTIERVLNAVKEPAMSEFKGLDNCLGALASLCPENIPELEVLPLIDLKVGDECLLIWSEEKEVWKVKSFCADGDIDIVDEKYKAHMCVPPHELRLAKFYFDSYLGDDFPIENHISPNCKAKDV